MNTLQQQQGNKFRRLEDKRRKCWARFRLSIRELVAKNLLRTKGKSESGCQADLKKFRKVGAGDLPCTTHIYIYGFTNFGSISIQY